MMLYLFAWHQNTVVFNLEPFLSVFFAQSVWSTNSALASSSSGDSLAWSFKDYKKVHTEDTNAWVVFDSQIDVFLDTESEATHGGEVTFFEFVFFNFQAGFENFFGFWASDGYSASDLFISSDTEGSDGESGFGEDWGLSGQLFQNFGGSGKPITTFSDANVQAKLGDSDIFHAVSFLSRGSHFSSVSST